MLIIIYYIYTVLSYKVSHLFSLLTFWTAWYIQRQAWLPHITDEETRAGEAKPPALHQPVNSSRDRPPMFLPELLLQQIFHISIVFNPEISGGESSRSVYFFLLPIIHLSEALSWVS